MIVHLLAWRTSMLRGSGKRTVLTAFEAVRFAFQIIVLDVCYDLVLGLESLMDSNPIILHRFVRKPPLAM